MNKCIFCGNKPENNNENDFWAIEHIIPKALGNKKLILSDAVCKACNSRLGSYVDGYFLNNFLVKFERNNLKIKGESGKVPNVFIEGTDQDGNKVILKNNHLNIVPKIEVDDDHVKIVATTKAEARDTFLKKADRKNLSETFKNKVLKTIDNSDSHSLQTTIESNFAIEYNRFFMEAAKIAYEFAIYKFGEDYLDDPRAIEIREYLNKAINGGMKDNCPELEGVTVINGNLFEKLQKYGIKNFHILVLWSANNKDIYAFVSLFMNPLFSFWVFLSDQAEKYTINEDSAIEIIEL